MIEIKDDQWFAERDYLPDDLRPQLRRAGVDRTILVQAAQTVAETEFLLDLAESTDFVACVVGWLDIAAGPLEPCSGLWRGLPSTHLLTAWHARTQ